MNIQPVNLEGYGVQLQPLGLQHVPGLWAANAADTWTFLPYGNIDSEEKMKGWVEEMLRRKAQGGDFPFAILQSANGQVVGATRYMTISPPNRSLEIGGSWLGLAWRGTGVNSTAKYLLLENAFERLGCLRVQFRTDLRNLRSQRAIERLGATREAALRKYSIMPDGYQRTSVFYSVIDDDWPQVKARLQSLLQAPPPA